MQRVYSQIVKRILDVFFSIILIVPVFVVILLCGISIIMTDGRPIFYNSDRLGKDGSVFRMFKLRTMTNNAKDIRNADGSTFNSINDPRITRIGRILRITSLDELPQLFNILKGDMSFIGPRPDLPDHISLYSRSDRRKLDVLPGITGYNQCTLRNSASWSDRLENDVYYVDNISFRLDAEIFFKTIIIVLLRKNVFIEETTQSTELSKEPEYDKYTI